MCHCKKCNNERSISIIYKRVESTFLRHINFPMDFVKLVLINQVDNQKKIKLNKAKANRMEVPRHLPSAAVSLERFITAYQAEREREGSWGDGGGREGARAPQQKKQSLDAKVELEIRRGSEPSVSAHVNHLQTGCLHPLVQIHHS